VVAPAVPGFLSTTEIRPPRHALGSARWLVSPDNPFGRRVVCQSTLEAGIRPRAGADVDDFGTQGEQPSHPELLDWLAVEFVESGWKRQAYPQTMVTSSTYRQASHAAREMRER